MKLIGGSVFGPDGQFHIRDVAAEGGMFTATAGGPVVNARGCYVIPGLVDIHTHGAVNADASDADAQGLLRMSRYYAQMGTTSYLATTMSLPEPALTAALKTIRDFTAPEDGAACLGVHLEGPFLCSAKRGAQAEAHLCRPDASMLRRLQDGSDGLVRMITVAPELEGAIDFIAQVSQECIVSLGHTACDYDTACRAYDAGASHATHLFNAMNPLLHRAPGLVGAALDCNASAELICDGMHIHPSVVRAAFCLYGEKLVLISDSARCAGMPDGDYELGGQPIVVTGGKATLHDGTLAGSSICMLTALQKAVEFGISLEQAVWAATAAPAKAAGLQGRVGFIEPGKQADCLVLGPDLHLRQVIVRGKAL